MAIAVAKGRGGMTMSSILFCTAGEHRCAFTVGPGHTDGLGRAAGAALGTSVGLQ